MRALPIPHGRDVVVRDDRLVTMAPGSPHRPSSVVRVRSNGAVEHLSPDGWIRISGPGVRPAAIPPSGGEGA